MPIQKTVENPASRRITVDVPREIPIGPVILTFSPAQTPDQMIGSSEDAAGSPNPAPLSKELLAYLEANTPRTIEEALEEAERKFNDPNRKPLSHLFGSHKGIFGGDGVAYQRKIRDEWN